MQQLEGLPFNSLDVPSDPWDNDKNTPIVFNSKGGEVIHTIPPLSANNSAFAKEPVDDSLCPHTILKKPEAERKARTEEAAADGMGIDKATPSSPNTPAKGHGRMLEGPQW